MTQVHNLFFAIRPDASAAALAQEAMQQQMERHDLRGSAVSLERLHVTLHVLCDHGNVSQDLLRRAEAAGGGLDMAPFGVGFDRIGSSGDASMGGLALTGSIELVALRRFQRVLAAGMTEAGLDTQIRTRFKPHVSLLYAPRHIAPEPIPPIRWQVNELVLIDSLVGQGKHIVRSRWPLQSRQLHLGDW